jgi:uncharacterized protein YceK
MRTLRLMLPLLAIGATLALAGCGGADTNTNTNRAKTSACLFTEAGTKLCGNDAYAWCNEAPHVPGMLACVRIDAAQLCVRAGVGCRAPTEIQEITGAKP